MLVLGFDMGNQSISPIGLKWPSSVFFLAS